MSGRPGALKPAVAQAASATCPCAQRSHKATVKWNSVAPFSILQHELNSSAKTGVGTPIYMAPEVIYGGSKYNAKVGGTGAAGRPFSCLPLPCSQWIPSTIA